MHIKLAKYCHHLEKGEYDEAFNTIEENYDTLLNNLHGTHYIVSLKQYKIILDLLKYNAILLKTCNDNNTTLHNYIDINSIILAVFEDPWTKKLLYISLALYLYDRDKKFDYSSNNILMIKHVQYLKLIINRYITNKELKSDFRDWVDNYKNEPDIVYRSIFENAPELISECLIWSPYTQY